MKVGMSYSRCVLDLVKGTVSLDDVLVIRSSTDFDPVDDEHWQSIWRGYCRPGRAWHDCKDQEDEFRRVSLDLWHLGKLHQPRRHGVYPNHSRDHWYELAPGEEEIKQRPAAVQDAWNHFQTLWKLSKD